MFAGLKALHFAIERAQVTLRRQTQTAFDVAVQRLSRPARGSCPVQVVNPLHWAVTELTVEAFVAVSAKPVGPIDCVKCLTVHLLWL